MGAGFAVIDLETTGFSPEHGDRIVEIGVVHLSPTGEITGEWTTLVNPMRDIGAQHVHGISAAAAAKAPTFDRIAPRIAELIDDRVPVAHNAAFDARFLRFQMRAAGMPIPEQDHWLCTMQLAKTVLPGARRRLKDCCAAAGIPDWEEHSALGDATVTARLLGYYLGAVADRSYWDAWVASAAHHVLTPVDAVPWIGRDAAFAPEPTLMEKLDVAVYGLHDDHLNVDYLALLDRVLLDRYVSSAESTALAALAHELGLSATAVHNMHQAYFDGLAASAWEDQRISDAERADVRAIGVLLGIPRERIDAALATEVSSTTLTSGFRLKPGDAIAMTGETRRPREEWFAILASRGYLPKASVTKQVKVLVAADPDSMSGKAQTARRYGIPIVNEDGLERLLAAAVV